MLKQRHEVRSGLRKNKFRTCFRQTQFPLALSCACSVHKVQGPSLNTGVISFDFHRQKRFNQSQMYVALSRIKSIRNMYLVGNYNSNTIKENDSAKEEYHRLRIKSR